MKKDQKNLRKNHSALILALALLLSPAVSRATRAYEAPPAGWSQGALGLSVNGEYFASEANYANKRGEFERLPLSGKFNVIETQTRARYGFSRAVSFYGGFGYARAEASDRFQTKSNGAFTDVHLGLNYLLMKKPFVLVPDLQFSYAIDTVSRTQTTPLTNDGASFGRAGFYAYKFFRRFRLQGYSGVQIPTENDTMRLLYEVSAEIPFGAFFIGGGVNGYEALTSDPLTQNDRTYVQTRANAYSSRFYANEPGLIEARAWAGYLFNSNLVARVGYGKTVNGLRTAEGQSLVFSLATNIPTLGANFNRGSDAEIGRGFPAPRARQRYEQSFEADSESVDQELFNEDPTDLPQPPPARKAPTTNPKVDLDQTEKLLERRRTQ